MKSIPKLTCSIKELERLSAKGTCPLFKNDPSSNKENLPAAGNRIVRLNDLKTQQSFVLRSQLTDEEDYFQALECTFKPELLHVNDQARPSIDRGRPKLVRQASNHQAFHQKNKQWMKRRKEKIEAKRKRSMGKPVPSNPKKMSRNSSQMKMRSAQQTHDPQQLRQAIGRESTRSSGKKSLERMRSTITMRHKESKQRVDRAINDLNQLIKRLQL